MQVKVKIKKLTLLLIFRNGFVGTSTQRKFLKLGVVYPKKCNNLTPSCLPNFTSVTIPHCSACIMGKSWRTNRPKHSESTASQIGQIILSDICAPLPLSNQGYKYFITFTDDYSKYIFVSPIKSKDFSTVLSIFKEVLMRIKHTKTQSNLNFIPIFRTDNGGEYTSKNFEQFCIAN